MSAIQGRVLLAVSARTRDRVLPCLAGCETVWAQTVGEVRAALARRFDLVIVGSHFDESHTFDIVAQIQAADRPPPIVCVRGRPFPGALGESTMQAFRAACGAVGVRLVIDLLDYADDPAGNRAIGALFERLLAERASPREATGA